MVFEVVDATSVSRDYREKFYIYESAGVREYWIVDPISGVVEANVLRRGKFRPIAKDADGVLRSTVVPEFGLKREWIGRDMAPRLIPSLKELGVTF